MRATIDIAAEAGKVPPQAPDLEQAVLGAVLLDWKAMGEVAGFLKPEHFYVGTHAKIWRACLDLYDKSQPIDLLTMTHHLRSTGELDIIGGPYYLSVLTGKMASARNIERHARIVVQEFVAREIIRTGAEQMRDGFDVTNDAFDVAETAERRVAEMLEDVARKTSTTIGAVADEHLENLDKPRERMHSTGFDRLDKALGGGYGKGDLVIIAGRPGMGKTSLAFSGCYFAAQQGHPTGLFSLELGEHKTNARFISIGTGIPLATVLDGTYTQEQLAQLHEHHARYTKMPIYTNFNNGITIPELRSEIGRLVRRKGITGAYIDQLNWVTPPKDHGGDRVGAITRGLKHIALEFDIPIIALHQLSRALITRGGDKRPDLTDLRDSGAVEQDAQVVLFAHRPEYYSIHEDEQGATAGRGDIIGAKNSNGPLFTVPLTFDGPCTAFREQPLAEPAPKFEKAFVPTNPDEDPF